MILFCILVAAVLIGMGTYRHAETTVDVMTAVDTLILYIFTAEILVKLLAQGRQPWLYFKSGWNVFDFLVVAFCYIGTGPSAVLRLLRLLRVLKLFSNLRQLQIILQRWPRGWNRSL